MKQRYLSVSDFLTADGNVVVGLVEHSPGRQLIERMVELSPEQARELAARLLHAAQAATAELACYPLRVDNEVTP